MKVFEQEVITANEVIEQAIDRRSPGHRFFDYMIERETIRLRKEAGEPPPWTEDPIFQEWSFTNVWREHDRTTVELRRIYDAHEDVPPEQVIINAASYRYTGRSECAQALGWQEAFDLKRFTDVVADRRARDLPVFTSAYIIHANPGDTRPTHLQVVEFLAGLWRACPELCRIATQGSWEKFVRRMMEVKGFGGSGFMSMQVALDSFYTSVWPLPPKDLNTWTAIGPGARRGVARLLSLPPRIDAVSEERCLKMIRYLYSQRKQFWPSDWIELELSDFQFCLCEFDKYERVRLGEGKPRRRYRYQPKI